MDRITHTSRLRDARMRSNGRRSAMLAGLLVAVLALSGCVNVSTSVTPPPDGTPFSGITPPPTREPETPEPDATPEPEDTVRPTRRPRTTPAPTPPPENTPKPTKKPTPAPDPTEEPTDEPTAEPTDAPTEAPTDAPTEAPFEGTPPPEGWPQGALGSTQAEEHVGETGTVCGVVVAAQYLPSRPGRPTFLNIDEPYPNQAFNVVIWGEQRRAFPLNRKPEVHMLGKTLCTTGAISAYVDWTQIAYADRAGTDIVP